MRILEHYWMSNKDWWYRDKNLVPRLKEDAPPEAQESYKRYLEQGIKVLNKIDKSSVNSQYDWYEVELSDGKKGYVYADGVEKREFNWKEMAERIDKSNKFFVQSSNEKKDIYVIDQYVALSKDVNTPKDKFGNRENQSIRAYTAPGAKEYINIPDRSVLKILEESNGYIKVYTLAYGGPYYISSANKAKLKKSSITFISEYFRFFNDLKKALSLFVCLYIKNLLSASIISYILSLK